MVRRLAVLAALISCGSPRSPEPVAPAANPDPATPAAPAQPTVRLPRNFLPTRYTARLAIDPAKAALTGAIEIAGTVAESSTVIWLHGYKLAIAKAVARQGTTEIALAVTPKGEDLLEIRAATPLAPGAWTLALDYTAAIDTVSTTGAFKQRVGKATYVFSQLEAIYARRVFPCVDEPSVKVPWQLTFDVPKADVVVSNTPQRTETSLDASTKRVEFAVTKPLPSYLVAFGIGPFDIIPAGKTKRGTPVRIVTLAGRAAEAAYAAQTTAKIVDATEAWFATPYPYEKLDILTIPLTVGFGAMENAGLITFTERLMLMERQPSQIHRRRWIGIAAHEIAHQWFGNLVTPVFWDDIWLNEGFATWLATKLTAELEPAWGDTESAISTRDEALVNDAIVSARKIRQPIASVDDIQTAFDRITYGKGAAILYMFENYLGADVFQRGVRAYLAARAFGNATSADFVSSISKAAGKPLDAAWGTFLDQAGAPEITATTTCANQRSELVLAQRRYLPPGAPEPAAQAPWIVPVCVAYDNAGKRAETCTLLDRRTATIPLPGTACPRWVMPNATGRGYYRNTYTVAQITALRDEAWPLLTWAERRALHLDVTTAARTGKLPLALALSFVPKLLAGNDRFTVEAAIAMPAGFDELVPDALRGKYESWLRAQFGAAARAVGLIPKDADTLDVERMREELVDAVAWTAREPTLVAEAAARGDRWRELPESIRGLVLAIAVDARPELFASVLREVVSEPDRANRRYMIEALGRVRDPVRYRAALDLVLDGRADVREVMDLPFAAHTEATREVAKQFVREHKDAIFARVPGAQVSGPLTRYARVFTSTCQADQRDDIAAYVMKTFASMPGGDRTVRQAIEMMDQCIARRAALEPELRAWLGGVRLKGIRQ